MFFRVERPGRKLFGVPPGILSASMIYSTCFIEKEIVKHKVRVSYQVQAKVVLRISTFREIVISG